MAICGLEGVELALNCPCPLQSECMMPRIEIFAIDHRLTGRQPQGKIIRPWTLEPNQKPGMRYADFCALYEEWRWFDDQMSAQPPPEIVGFMGYRKYFWSPEWMKLDVTPAHAPNWYNTDTETFDWYRAWLAQWDGAELLPILATHDIIVTPPFPLQVTMWRDFYLSRSPHDAIVCGDAAAKLFENPNPYRVYPYLFITRWSVFNRLMREIEPIRKELNPLITAEDAIDGAYMERPMAYVMERVFSLWLENSGLATYELPLLHCWEMT